MKHRKSTRISVGLIGLLPVLVISACQTVQINTTEPATPLFPTETTTPSPVDTPSPNPTATPVPSETPTPTRIAPTLTPTPSVSGPVAEPELPSVSHGPLPFQASAVLGLGQIVTHALSPDGEYLAVGGEAALRLYQIDPFRELWSAETPVWHIQWLETGQTTLIATQVDDRLQTWEIGNGIQIGEVVLEHPGKTLYHVTWSPDGTLIAAASGDHQEGGSPDASDMIMIWETATGNVRQQIRNLGRVEGLEWSPDGTTLISASYYGDDSTTASGGQVFLWSVETGNALIALDAHALATALSPDGSTLAVGEAEGSITLVDPETLAPIRALRAKLNEFSGALAWSPDGRQIAGGGVGEFAIWDVERDELPRIIYLDTIPQSVTSLDWSPDGEWLGVGTTRSGIVLDVASGTSVNTIDEGQATQIRFTPDGQYYLLQEGDMIEIWSAEEHELLHSLVGTPGIAAVAFNQDGSVLYAAGEDRVIAWDVATRQPLYVLLGPPDQQIKRLGLSADEQFLLAEVSGEAVLLWDLSTGEYGWLPYNALPSEGPPSDQFALNDRSGLVIWDVVTYEEIHRFEEPATAVAWSPDRTLMAVAATGITLYDPETWEPIGTVGADVMPYPVRQLAFSPAGHRIAALLDDGTMVGWRVSNNERLFSLSEGLISDIAWSQDGKMLFAGTSRRVGGRVLRWYTPDGELQPSFKGHARPVSTIALSPDGTILASGSPDGTVILWGLDS
jgi:WD40 repeat protein